MLYMVHHYSHKVFWIICNFPDPLIIRFSQKFGVISIFLTLSPVNWSGDHVQHLAPSNSGAVFLNSNVCRGTLLVFRGSNIYRETFLVFPYSNISWGTLLVFPDTNLCSKILLHTILWGKCQKYGKTTNFCKSLKRSGSGKV